MPTFRENPYGAFNFIVALGGDQGSGEPGEIVGGFSEVSGLGFEVQYAEYRNGNSMVNTVEKIQNTFTNEDVTLKRGMIGSDDLFRWLQSVREGAIDKRDVTITHLDEARNPVGTIKLVNAQPSKYTGTTFTAAGGTDTATEELVMKHEGIFYT